MCAVSEIMTTDVQVVAPDESLQRAAQIMDQLQVESLPVCERGRLLGIVTEHDIAVRGTAAGLTPVTAHVADVMSRDREWWCTGDLDTEVVMRVMGDARMRRVPVIDGDRKLVGIVSLGDLEVRHAVRDDSPIGETTDRTGRAPAESSIGSL
jgi:CBS domain-containing protein